MPTTLRSLASRQGAPPRCPLTRGPSMRPRMSSTLCLMTFSSKGVGPGSSAALSKGWRVRGDPSCPWSGWEGQRVRGTLSHSRLRPHFHTTLSTARQPPGIAQLTGYSIPLPLTGLLKLSYSVRASSLFIPAKAALNESRAALPPPRPPRPPPRPPRLMLSFEGG